MLPRTNVDFEGTLRVGDQAIPVYFDVKSTKHSRWSFRELSSKQLSYLMRHRELGAWTFVLLFFVYRRKLPDIFCLPIDCFGRIGFKSHNLSDDVISEGESVHVEELDESILRVDSSAAFLQDVIRIFTQHDIEGEAPWNTEELDLTST